MQKEDICVNSVPSGFGSTLWDGHTAFSFEVWLCSKEDGDLAIFRDHKLTEDYSGISVSMNAKDDHIAIGQLIPLQHAENGNYGYSVTGWFDEPTDLDITLTDEDGNVLQKMVLTIEPVFADGSYNLTVKDLLINNQ